MANLTASPSGNHLPDIRFSSEKKLGILHYTSFVDFGWHGDIRKRYTDFIVHEVRKDGTVVYLTDVNLESETRTPVEPKNANAQSASEPKDDVTVTEKPETPEPKPAEPPSIDVEALETLLGPIVAKQMQDVHAAIVNGTAAPQTKITIAVALDRTKRGHVHQEIRRIFSGRFETRADGESGAIIATPAPRGSRLRNSGRGSSKGNGRDDRGRNAGGAAQNKGKYLHFTLYKENKDTMEAINHLARILKIKSANFGFSGTKDRRAATTQRVSVWRYGNQDLAWINPKLHNIKIGDFSYHKSPIQLGQHGGNDFVIVVKNVELLRGTNCSLSHRLRMTEMCVQTALDHIQKHGFINYFGLQRFGTHTIGTQEVGLKILSEDFEGACNAILYVDPELVASLSDPNVENVYHRDEANRARAITMFKTSGDLTSAMQILPKRFSAEGAIIQHLGRDQGSRRDFCGALLRITRGLRNLYIHAYQSFVWNWATSLRWSKYGDQVIAGDLVLVESEANPTRYRQGHDMSEDLNQEEEQFYQEARVLSAEEVASGQYTIFDIVLPVPGYDVLYPDNDIGEFYAEFMGRPENGKLDPYRMRRRQKEFSLSGHYRKIMARFAAVPQFFVRPYSDDAEQMHPTDLDEIKAQMQEVDTQPEQSHVASGENAIVDITNETDAGSNAGRRRRLSPGQSSDLIDLRVNDAWVENTSDGGSKRIKVEPKQSDETAPPYEADTVMVLPDDAPLITLTNNNKPLEDDSNDAGLPTVEDVTRMFDQGGSSAALAKTADFDANDPGNNSHRALDASVPAFTPRSSVGSTLPPSVEIKNLFRAEQDRTNGPDAEASKKAGGNAVNLTSAWRRSAPDFVDAKDMDIAVALNFRLSSSNYATICLREMMSSTVGSPADAAMATTAAPTNGAGFVGSPRHTASSNGHLSATGPAFQQPKRQQSPF